MCAKRFSIVDTCRGKLRKHSFLKGVTSDRRKNSFEAKEKWKKVRNPKVQFFAENFDPTKIFYHIMKPRISENTMQSLSGDKNLIKQSNYQNNDEKKSHANLKKTKKKKKRVLV